MPITTTFEVELGDSASLNTTPQNSPPPPILNRFP